MNWGNFAVNFILGVFILGGVGLIGYLFYVFFIKLRENFKMQPKKSQEPKESNKDKKVKGSYCSKCGALY